MAQPVPAAPQSQPVQPNAPQRLGVKPSVALQPGQEEQEKHTVPPEIPFAAYHMAGNEFTFERLQRILTNINAEQMAGNITSEDAQRIAEDANRQYQESKGIKTDHSEFGGYGFTPEDKLTLKTDFRVIAAAARGGWKRISMSTVQSDDKRFTITHVDQTRRSDWFLLKDLETGQIYEEVTMTGAKKKAREIRGDAEVEDDTEDEVDWDNFEGPEYHGGGDSVDTLPKAASKDKSNTKTPYRPAKLAVEETMATPIQEKTQKAAASKWARLRRVAAEEPKEADSAIAEVAEALGTMADALCNLKENLDLVEAPKTASIKVRVATSRRYATAFRRIADEAPEVVAGAISEVYHSLDDVAGALENLAENMGIELSLTPAEAAFGEEGQSELAGEWGPEEPESGAEPTVDESEFEEAEKELESPEAVPAEEKLDEEIDKEAAATEWTTDRDEEGKPKAPVIAAKKKELPDFLKKKKDEKDEKKKEKKADGGAAFVTDRDNNAKPEAPSKVEIPQAQGESEVNKAAAKRAALRQRIAKRWGVEV